MLHSKFYYLFISFLIMSCSIDHNGGKQFLMWEQHGLEDAITYVIRENDGTIYAGTDQGLYYTTSPTFLSWSESKLNISRSRVLGILASENKILVSLRFEEHDEANETLYESDDYGRNWKAIEASIEGRLSSDFLSSSIIDQQTNDLSVLYGYDGTVNYTMDSGYNWEVIYDKMGFIEFLNVSYNHRDHIWIGGTLSILAPYLAKSEDGGETWTNLSQRVYFNADATAMTATVSPDDTNTVLVGFSGFGAAIRKTVDGGENWKTVLEEYRVFAMGNGLESPSRVYAAGQYPPTGNLTLAVSDDYGESWNIIEYEEGPDDMTVNDLAVAEVNGRETVFLGTNQGVYSYTPE